MLPLLIPKLLLRPHRLCLISSSLMFREDIGLIPLNWAVVRGDRLCVHWFIEKKGGPFSEVCAMFRNSLRLFTDEHASVIPD